MPTMEEFLASHGAEVPSREDSGSTVSIPPPPPELGLAPPPPIPSGAPLPPITSPPPFLEQLRGSTFGPRGLLGPESLGTMAGAAVGAPLVPFFGPGPPLVGAGVGGALGKGLEMFWEQTSKDQMTDEDWFEEMSMAGVKGIAAEKAGGMTGKVFVSAVDKVLSPMAHKVNASRLRIIEEAKKLRIRLTGSQRTGSGVLAQIESVPTQFPLGSGPALRYAEAQNKEMSRAVNNFAQQIAPGFTTALEEVGKALKLGSTAKFEAAKAHAKTLYDGIDSLIKPDAEFPANNLFEVASAITKTEANLRGKLKSPAAGVAENLKDLSEKVPGVGALISPVEIPARIIQDLNLATEDAKTMTFSRLRDLQSRLGALVAETPRGEAKKKIRQLYAALLDDMDEVADSVPGLSAQMKLANSWYKKEVAENFIKNEAFDDISENDASTLASTLLGPNVSIEQVKRIKSALPPRSFDRLVAGWLSHMVQARSLGEAEEFSVRKFINNTNRRKYSPQVLEEILGPERVKGFNSLRRVFLTIHASHVGGGNPSTTSRSILGERQIENLARLGIGGFGQLATGGILFGAGVNPVAAAVLGSIALFTPITIAKIVYSKKGAEFLSTGLKLGPTGKNRAFQTARIPVLLGISKTEWPFPTEAQIRGDIQSMEKAAGVGQLLPPDAPQDPKTGVNVEVPSSPTPQSLPPGLFIPQ